MFERALRQDEKYSELQDGGMYVGVTMCDRRQWRI